MVFHFTSHSLLSTQINFVFEKFLCADQLETSTPPPRPLGKKRGIWTFEDWIVQIPALSGQNGVQMLYPIVGFVCQMPLFKNNRPRLLSFLTTLVHEQANTVRDPSLIWWCRFTRLLMPKKHNFNTETIKKRPENELSVGQCSNSLQITVQRNTYT